MNKLLLTLIFCLTPIFVIATNYVYVVVPEGTDPNLLGGSGGGSGAATNLVYDGTNSPNYSSHYLGYPKLTLTTNMVSSSVGGDTPITQTSFTNAFDNNFDTETSTGTWNADQHAYIIDLGAVYSGYVVYSMVLSNSNASANSLFGYCYGGDSLTVAAGLPSIFWGGSRNTAVNGPDISCLVGSGVRTSLVARIFTGRKIAINGETSAYVSSYRFKEIMVFGVTNGFNGVGGTLPQ